MKVPFVFGPGDLRLCDVDEPKAGPRDVVVKVHCVGICGTDLGLVVTGGRGREMALGHELSATVIEVGDEVKALKTGDRVILNPLPNLIGNGGPEGGFADKLLVRDVVGKPGSLMRLPDSVSAEAGALVEPIAVACHAANRLGATPESRVAIFGAGPIGLALLTVLKHRGIEDVVVFELSESRRNRAEKIGARAVIDSSARDFREALIELHGSTTWAGGNLPLTSHYLEVTGAPIMGDILDAAAPHSTICIVAMHKKPSSAHFMNVMAKELTVLGAMGYPNEFDEALEMVASGAVDIDALVSHRFDSADIMEAFEAAKQTQSSAKVLIQYGD